MYIENLERWPPPLPFSVCPVCDARIYIFVFDLNIWWNIYVRTKNAEAEKIAKKNKNGKLYWQSGLRIEKMNDGKKKQMKIDFNEMKVEKFIKLIQECTENIKLGLKLDNGKLHARNEMTIY